MPLAGGLPWLRLMPTLGAASAAPGYRPKSAAISDVDGDGQLDAVAMGRLEQASDLAGLLVCLGSGAGKFLPPVSTFLGIQGTFAPGDLDGDAW